MKRIVLCLLALVILLAGCGEKPAEIVEVVPRASIVSQNYVLENASFTDTQQWAELFGQDTAEYVSGSVAFALQSGSLVPAVYNWMVSGYIMQLVTVEDVENGRITLSGVLVGAPIKSVKQLHEYLAKDSRFAEVFAKYPETSYSSGVREYVNKSPKKTYTDKIFQNRTPISNDMLICDSKGVWLSENNDKRLLLENTPEQGEGGSKFEVAAAVGNDAFIYCEWGYEYLSSVGVYNVKTNEKTAFNVTDDGVPVAVKDGKVFMFDSHSGRVYFIDIASTAETDIVNNSERAVYSVAVSPNGDTVSVLYGGYEASVETYSVKDGSLLKTVNINCPFEEMQYIEYATPKKVAVSGEKAALCDRYVYMFNPK